MKKIKLVLFISMIVAAFQVNAATHTCECNVKKLYAGFVGGTGNSTKSKVECSSGDSFYLGTLNTELGKTRHSMALAAQMAEKLLVLQYWSADGSKTCSVASSDTTIYPDGVYVE